MTLDGYLLCIIGTALFSAIITSIIPEGKTSATVKGMAKLICLISILSPIPQFLQKQDFFEFFQEKNQQTSLKNISQSVITVDEPFIEYFSKMRVTVLQNQIQTLIETTFHTQCTVTFTYTIDEGTAMLNVEKIEVCILNDVSDAKKEEIGSYLQTKYGVEVEVGE